MPIVVDASALLPLALDDEDRQYAEAVVKTIAATSAHVPAVFWYEIWNALWVNVTKRERITLDAAAEFLHELDQFQLALDPAVADHLLLADCVALNTTAYDAAYLGLARKLQCPLATRDEQLKAACKRAKVSIFLDTAA